MKPLILLTNDDGFFAEGIQILRDSVSKLGDIYIVAPDRERSATSLALTLHHPLRVKQTADRIFSVDGTPADCIYLALQKLLPRRPELILSGINPGPNLGQQDISYSGTVAGAVQGTFLQIPSAAVSCLPDEEGTCHFGIASRFAEVLARRLLENSLPQGITLNINIPPPPIKGIRTAKLGEKRYNPEILVKKDPRQRDYYWIGTGKPKALGDRKSDVRIIEDGFITITPLHRDLTDYEQLDDSSLNAWLEQLQNEMA